MLSTLRHYAAQRSGSQTILRPAKTFVRRNHVETVKMAYDLWEPQGGVSGDSTPIVFLHGLFGSKNNNRSVSRILAKDLKTKVYCPDFRNHGESPHNPRHDYQALAADVHRFIKDHKIARPIVIGHSMGAKAAMAVALEQPQSVSALIPVDNAPLTIGLSPEFGRYIQGMKEVDRAKVDNQAEMYKILAPYCPELPIQQFLLSNFKRSHHTHKYHSRLPLDILGRSLGSIADFDHYRPPNFVYGGPTLFIRGKKSSFVPDETIPIMGQLFPRFVIRDIDSGHWVISEKPREFVEEVERFLDDDD